MAPKSEINMKDYTSNNYCDFLWINELLALEKSSKAGYIFESWKNGKPTYITISNVIIFGTIVEVKQVGCRGHVYLVDDGTGVIGCKHNEKQFEEIISVIEGEQFEMLNRTYQCEESGTCNYSADDSVFNDKSIQNDELSVNERNKYMGLQSIWDDIYQSFNSLIESYNVGDSVVIQGKLYSYFNKNQIYINSIRKMDFAEEISKVAIKLEEKFDKPRESSRPEFNEKRLSGLMTFDSIQRLDPKFSNPRSIKVPELNNVWEESKVLTPNLKSTITFDTFPS